MEYIQFTGKTRLDAISKAMEKFSVSEDRLDIQVLDEGSKGFLGIGAKDYVIQARKLVVKEDIIIDYIKKIYACMDIDVEVEVTGREDTLLVDIKGEEASVLIGRHAESLDALQTIVNIVLSKETGEHTRVILDIENYRSRREESLISYAKKMAQKVINRRRSIKLDPMNPYERRIIHSALQENDKITTFSEGEDPNRRIVLALKRGVSNIKKRYEQ
ncbi:MAG: protein jag [Peptostreptococcaceae bacterium]|nr:protein jag [Peptostreptococcaceae bacterium]